MSDAVNIFVFFDQGDIIFGSLTLFCLVVPGYFGISHLLKSQQFLDDYHTTRSHDQVQVRLRRIVLYLFCIVLFPAFNIVFKASKLFLHPSSSLNDFSLGIDQVKSLFEDSPQLALQLFISFIKRPRLVQILSIFWSSLCVAVPNVRSLMVFENSRIDSSLFSLKRDKGKRQIRFQVNCKSRIKSLKSITKHFAFYLMFVLISFTRAASIATIVCFLRYNAILIYLSTFLALKIVFDIAKLTFRPKALVKISKETPVDMFANAFNILDLTKESSVIWSYAVFWMTFNVIVMVRIYGQCLNISSEDPLFLNLWIAPSMQLANWSELYIVQENIHKSIIITLCFLNMLSCLLICLVIKPLGSKMRPKYDALKTEDIDEVLKTKLGGGRLELSEEEKEKIWSPYSSSNHFESILQDRKESGRLSTMTHLKDPWDFVGDYVLQLLKETGYEPIDHFLYEDSQQLLLKIMKVFKPMDSSENDPRCSEVFQRCRRHYEFLEELNSVHNLRGEEKKKDIGASGEFDRKPEHELKAVPEQEVGPQEVVVYNPVSALSEALRAVCLHMRIIGLGLRNIKRDLPILEVLEKGEPEKDKEKDDFENIFILLHKQIVTYGQGAFCDTETIVQEVKKVFTDFVDYVVENKIKDRSELIDVVEEMKIKLSKFKTNAGVIVKKHTRNLTEMAKFESVAVNSISKFNAVTERYKKEVEILEKESQKGAGSSSRRILAAWEMITLGLSIQVLKVENEESRKNEENETEKKRMKEAERIQEKNKLRENIAITAKAVVIPSLKNYFGSFRKIAGFFSDLLDDLETLDENQENEYFESLHSKSNSVKEICGLFPSVMVEARTNLAV